MEMATATSVLKIPNFKPSTLTIARQAQLLLEGAELINDLNLRMKQIKDLSLEGVKEPTDAVGTLKKILSLLP